MSDLPGYGNIAVIGTPMTESDVPFRFLRRVSMRGLFLLDTLFKRSEEVLDYQIDLSHWLESDETIEAARAWCVPDGPPTDADAFVLRAQFSQTCVLVWMANGVDGGRAIAHCRIVTSKGRSILVRFMIRTRGVPGTLVLFGSGDDVTVGVVQPDPPVPPDPPNPTTAGVLSASATTLDFAETSVGTPAAGKTILLSNTGAASLVITSINITGDFAFTMSGAATIAPGDTATITIVFTPTAIGSRTGSLTINSSGGIASVALSGTGVSDPAVGISNADLVSDPTPTTNPIASVSVISLSFPDTVV